MKRTDLSFTARALADIFPKVGSGKTARSLPRSLEPAGQRLRRVECEAVYFANHGCDRGHVFQVLTGDATMQLRDGRVFALSAGPDFVVSDHGDRAHRVGLRGGVMVSSVD